MKKQSKGTAEERVAAFLKNKTRRYTAEQVAEKCDCCAGYVRMFDSWKEYQKQFIEPTADERVQEYLSNVGKTIPPLNVIAAACKCDMSTVVRTPSWRAHVKRNKLLSAKERVETFLNAVWNEPKKYTAQQVAKQCRCSCHYVYGLDIWNKYRSKTQPTEERIRKLLSKDKNGTKQYTRKEVVDKLQLGKNTIICSKAWQEHKNGFRQAEGQEVVKYKTWKNQPSPQLENRIASYLSKHKGKEETVGEVATAVGCSKASIQRSKSWKQHRKHLAKPKVEKIIRSLLFAKNGKPKLNDNTGEKYKTREVLAVVGCSTVRGSKSWTEYQQCFTSPPVEKRIKQFLSKDKTGKRGFTKKEVAAAVGCSVPTVYRSESWKQYQEKREALRPVGTAIERIEKALRDLLAAGEIMPTLGQVAEKAKCHKDTVFESPAWKAHRQSLVPPITPDTDTADYPRLKQAPTGVNVPDTIEAKYNESIEDSDGSVPNVNVFNEDSLADKIGKSVVRNIVLNDNIPRFNEENQVLLYASLGHQPIEIVEILHPKLKGSERREKSKRYGELIRDNKKSTG